MLALTLAACGVLGPLPLRAAGDRPWCTGDRIAAAGPPFRWPPRNGLAGSSATSSGFCFSAVGDSNLNKLTVVHNGGLPDLEEASALLRTGLADRPGERSLLNARGLDGTSALIRNGLPERLTRPGADAGEALVFTDLTTVAELASGDTGRAVTWAGEVSSSAASWW